MNFVLFLEVLLVVSSILRFVDFESTFSTVEVDMLLVVKKFKCFLTIYIFFIYIFWVTYPNGCEVKSFD